MKFASRVTEEGNVSVRVNSIDNMIIGKEITYIKLDVEGSGLRIKYMYL